MEKKLLVLLVEDDEDASAKIINYIDEQDDVLLSGVTNSSYKALVYAQETLPDAVILDLELHKGAGNGLFFLQGIQTFNPEIRPYILITTNNSSAVTYETARQLGADFIMYKHQTDYSAQNVIEFLKMMKNVIHERRIKGQSHNITESPEQKNKRLRRIISLELDKVGISPKVVGYQYLIEGILSTMKKPENNLCSAIATKVGRSDASVERAMQNAINRAWRSTDIDELLKHYTAHISSDKGFPTIMEFVFYYASKIHNSN